jgi:multiple sugar transport system permease protein
VNIVKAQHSSASSVATAFAASSGAVGRSTPVKRKPRLSNAATTGIGFFLPFAVLFLATVVVPLVYAIYLSGFQSRFVGGEVFVGLGNYLRTISDTALLTGLLRVVGFMALQIPIMLGLAVIISIVIDSGRLYFPAVFRLGIFIPYAIPSVVAALMWGYIYGSQFGLVGQTAALLGQPAPDLLSKQWMIPSMANISIWQYTGYNMLIFYAGLQSIPREIYEAADIDGAGEFTKAWHIKLPALRPALFLSLFFSVIGGIQLFTEPSILQSLAPTTIVSDYTPALYMYNLAVKSSQYEYAAALAVTLGGATIIAVAIVQFVLGRNARRAG